MNNMQAIFRKARVQLSLLKGNTVKSSIMNYISHSVEKYSNAPELFEIPVPSA